MRINDRGYRPHFNDAKKISVSNDLGVAVEKMVCFYRGDFLMRQQHTTIHDFPTCAFLLSAAFIFLSCSGRGVSEPEVRNVGTNSVEHNRSDKKDLEICYENWKYHSRKIEDFSAWAQKSEQVKMVDEMLSSLLAIPKLGTEYLLDGAEKRLLEHTWVNVAFSPYTFSNGGNVSLFSVGEYSHSIDTVFNEKAEKIQIDGLGKKGEIFRGLEEGEVKKALKIHLFMFFDTPTEKFVVFTHMLGDIDSFYVENDKLNFRITGGARTDDPKYYIFLSKGKNEKDWRIHDIVDMEVTSPCDAVFSPNP